MAVAYGSSSSAVASSGSNISSLDLGLPSGTAAGDLLVACLVATQSQTITNPSGFTTLLTQDASTGVRMRVAWKVAAGGDNVTFSVSPSTSAVAGSIVRITGADTVSPIRDSAGAGSASATSGASPALAGTQPTDMVVIFGGVRPESASATNDVDGPSSGGWTAPAAAKSGPSNNPFNFPAASAAAYQIAGTTGTFTCDVASGFARAAVSIIAAADSGGAAQEGPMPTYVGVGSPASSTGSGATPTLPSGWQEGDIFLLCCESMNGIGGAAPSGWDAVSGSPAYANTGSNTTRTALEVYWRRATASESNPSLGDAGDHVLAIVHAVRGCLATGDPIDASSGTNETTSDTSGTAPAVVTTDINRFIVVACSGATDTSSTNRFTAVSNANLSSLTERSDSATTQGNGGTLGVFTGEKATAGSTGTTSITYANSSAKGLITVALRPTQTVSPGDSVGVLMA